MTINEYVQRIPRAVHRKVPFTVNEKIATIANSDTPDKDVDVKIVEVNKAVKNSGTSDEVSVKAEDPK